MANSDFDRIYEEQQSRFESRREGGHSFNTNWEHSLRSIVKVLSKMDFSDLELYRNLTFAIYNGRIYGETLNKWGRAKIRWYKLFECLISAYRKSDNVKLFNCSASELPNAILSVSKGDGYQYAKVLSYAFFASRSCNSNAPLWFDWFQRNLLVDQFQKGKEIHLISKYPSRSQTPIWRGSSNYIPKVNKDQLAVEDIFQILNDNVRLKLVNFSSAHPDLLDAKLSSQKPNSGSQRFWNYSDRPYVSSWLDFDPIKPEKYYTMYQNVIVVDGIAAAFRLVDHFRHGQTVLLQMGNYEQYFYSYMLPWVHFVPLNKDLSDLKGKLIWIRDNPEKSQQICINGRKFYKNYLSLNPSFDLSWKIIHRISKLQADLDFEEFIEKKQLIKYPPP